MTLDWQCWSGTRYNYFEWGQIFFLLVFCLVFQGNRLSSLFRTYHHLAPQLADQTTWSTGRRRDEQQNHMAFQRSSLSEMELLVWSLSENAWSTQAAFKVWGIELPNNVYYVRYDIPLRRDKPEGSQLIHSIWNHFIRHIQSMWAEDRTRLAGRRATETARQLINSLAGWGGLGIFVRRKKSCRERGVWKTCRRWLCETKKEGKRKSRTYTVSLK